MQSSNFEQTLPKILEQDSRYDRGAYFFLREALDFTQKTAPRSGEEEVRHVTGQELLAGIRQYAIQQYGPMALTVLEQWGVHRCEDFGEIVFNLVEHNLLAKTEKDGRADFAGGYDFAEAFRRPFQPAAPRGRPVPEPKSSQV